MLLLTSPGADSGFVNICSAPRRPEDVDLVLLEYNLGEGWVQVLAAYSVCAIGVCVLNCLQLVCL